MALITVSTFKHSSSVCECREIGDTASWIKLSSMPSEFQVGVSVSRFINFSHVVNAPITPSPRYDSQYDVTDGSTQELEMEGDRVVMGRIDDDQISSHEA